MIAINDICQVVNYSQTLLFADDFKIFREVLNVNDCECLQRDLHSAVDWCEMNGFSLNVTKCSSMSFTLNKNVLNHTYFLNNVALQQTSSQKDLGVLIDNTLNFGEHMVNKINEAHRLMGFIIRSTRHFNVDVCLKLFDSLVLPKLEYCSSIWSPQYEVWSKSIERVHRKFLKYMFYKRFGYYPNQGYDHMRLLAIFDRLSLENRRIKACLVYLFKILKNKIDCPDILSQLPFVVTNGARRQRSTFYLQFPRINAYKNSPVYRMCSYFNLYVSDLDLDSIKINRFIDIINQKLLTSQAQI